MLEASYCFAALCPGEPLLLDDETGIAETAAKAVKDLEGVI